MYRILSGSFGEVNDWVEDENRGAVEIMGVVPRPKSFGFGTTPRETRFAIPTPS